MKLFAALVLLAAAAPFSFAQLDEATCASQTSMLTADATIQAEYVAIASAIETDATNNFLSFCSLLDFSCDIDVDDYATSFNTACASAGGQVTSKSLSFECTGMSVCLEEDWFLLYCMIRHIVGQ